jgi:hypothetical protein
MASNAAAKLMENSPTIFPSMQTGRRVLEDDTLPSLSFTSRTSWSHSQGNVSKSVRSIMPVKFASAEKANTMHFKAASDLRSTARPTVWGMHRAQETPLVG